MAEAATACLEKSREKFLASANKKRRNIVFYVNDTVVLSTEHPWFQTLVGVKKLKPAWNRPFQITEIPHNISPDT